MTEIKVLPARHLQPLGMQATVPLNHNAEAVRLKVSVKLFNSLSRFAGGHAPGAPITLEVPAGTTVADLLTRFQMPREDVFLVLVNGRDITPRMGEVRTAYALEDGDQVAFTGPIPYSPAYGAPIV